MASISFDVGEEKTRYARKNADSASIAHPYPNVKMARRCGTSAIFRLVMNPKMKNSAVTVINGTRYPGDVSAADCFLSVAIEGCSPLSQESFALVRAFACVLATEHSQDRRQYSPSVGLPSLRNPGVCPGSVLWPDR